METKICRKCNIEKEIISFSVEAKPGKKAYRRNTCKSCKYKQCNAETVRAKNNRWNIKHREYRRQYQKDNRAIISAIEKERYKTDPEFKLRKILRASLKTRLKRMFNKTIKSSSAVKDLGCSIQEFKQYLEAKFQPGMTWENYGLYGWHIDHIIPLSKFNLTDREQFLKACHYSNLQPLWAKDNLTKGAKYDESSSI